MGVARDEVDTLVSAATPEQVEALAQVATGLQCDDRCKRALMPIKAPATNR